MAENGKGPIFRKMALPERACITCTRAEDFPCLRTVPQTSRFAGSDCLDWGEPQGLLVVFAFDPPEKGQKTENGRSSARRIQARHQALAKRPIGRGTGVPAARRRIGATKPLLPLLSGGSRRPCPTECLKYSIRSPRLDTREPPATALGVVKSALSSVWQ